MPAANQARIRRATSCLVACVALLAASVVWAVLVPSVTIVLMVAAVAATVALCALARAMWGWLDTTPARRNAVRLARWAPFVVYVLYGVALLLVGERLQPLVAYLVVPGLAAALAAVAAAKRG